MLKSIKIYPFPISRNHHTNRDLTKVFELFLEGFEVVNREYNRTTIKSAHGKLCFWSENYPYAYASDGVYTSPTNHTISWDSEMPSRWAVKQMQERLAETPAVPRFKI